MQVVVIGCGRVGAALTRHLVESGEDVVVIDQDRGKLDKISELDCLRINGMIIDQDTMRMSGMDNADVVCCVSDNENLNIMAGQTAKEFFKVPLVIVRVFNTANLSVFEEPGFRLISSTEITLNEILDCFINTAPVQAIEIQGNIIHFVQLETKKRWINMELPDVEHETDGHILGILRDGRLILSSFNRRHTVREGDNILLVRKEGK